MDTTNKYKYIGFNDTWFMLIGIPFLGIVTTFIFNRGNANAFEIVISIIIASIFSGMNWLVMRQAMIMLRKKFPTLKESLKRYIILFLFIILTISTINLIGNLIFKQVFGPDFHSGDFSAHVVIGIISVMTLSIYEVIYYLNKLKKSIINEEQTRQVVVQSQLDALRNQARPHFLFNSLNTLRDIVENDPKTQATSFIDHLADVYRFILDTGNDNVVTVREEVAFAKSYEYIQKERFGDNLQIEWNIPQHQMDKMIIPMSIQLLLENAIKHNVVSKAKPLKVEVSFVSKSIQVTNNLQVKRTKMPSTKLGLENIKKRYELSGMAVPSVIKSDSHFTVTLPIFEN